MKIKYIIRFAVFLAITKANAQTSPSYALNVVPQSPNVASLGKYGDVPVGYFTGIPNISVPLYDIKLKHLDQQISLSYHGGGIKVEEMASSVGLGWALNANGIISRQIRGLPDELQYGYMQNANTSYSAASLINLEKQNYATNPSALYDGSLSTNVIAQKIDTEPDIFYFNMGATSGKFFFDQTSAQFICVSNKKIRIQYNYGNATLDYNWLITTEDGTSYYFKSGEQSKSTSTACSDFSRGYQTSWFLSKITNAYDSDEIDFLYENVAYNYQTLSTGTVYTPTNGIGPYTPSPPPFGACGFLSTMITGIGTQRLKQITFPNGGISFIYSQCRADLIGDNALNTIEVYQNNTLFKRYTLNYDYFGNIYNTVSQSSSYCDVTNATNKQNSVNYRLKLLSVVTQGSDGIQTMPPYTFQYFENSTYTLPNRLSFDQDFLGYWNGPKGNTTLVPSSVINSTTYSGADRSPDPLYAQACTLTGITYPTGGSTSFQWEGNQLPNTGTVPGQLQDKEQGVSQQDLVLGQQVIKTFQINSQPDVSNGYQYGAYTTYTYAFSGSCNSPFGSCVQIQVCDMSGNIIFTMATDGSDTSPHYLANGSYQLKIRTAANAQVTSFSAFLYWKELVVSSQVNTITTAGLRVQSITDQNTDGTAYTKYFKYESDDNTHASSGSVALPPAYNYSIIFNQATYVVRNSYTNYPLATTQGSYVYYSRVSVYDGDIAGSNGKTILQYTSPPDQWASNNGDFIGAFDATGIPFPPVISKDHLRGLLLSKNDFKYQNGSFIPVKLVTNTYTTTPNISTRGIKYMQNSWQTPISATAEGTISLYASQFYDTESDWVYLSSSTDRTYDQVDATKYVDIVKNYTYDPVSLQNTQVNETNSKGEQLITQMAYPLSYLDADGGTVINDMKGNRFIQNAVIQKTASKIDNQGNNKLISSQITQYNYTPGTGTTYIAPVEIDAFETLQTIDPTNAVAFPPYKPVNGYNTNLFKKRVSYYYDANGNVVQQHLDHGNYISYLWGYNNQYPVAQAINSTNNDIFYDSFEQGDGNSTLNDSKTGHYSYTGSYSKTLSGLDAGTYTLSYWSKLGSIWSFIINNSVSVTGTTYPIALSGQIDDVRFYPSAAKMISYTYDPLIGMTSSADAKGEITYYEYDPFQRLMNIRDKDKNIIKHLDYHYQGQ